MDYNNNKIINKQYIYLYQQQNIHFKFVIEVIKY